MESSVMVQCPEFSRLTSWFSFTFNTLDQEPAKLRTHEVKKKSPSTLKRNAARKERFLQDKKTSSEKETLADSFKCDQFDHQANCKASLRNHVGKEHKVIPQLDGIDDSNLEKETSSRTEGINSKKVEVQTKIDKPKEDSKKTTSTFKFYSEINDEEREVHDRNQEEEAKASGSWCYECNDKLKNNTILKMHMETDHKSKSF